MTIEQKVNYVKFWLQCFGNRDNETFHITVTVASQMWEIWLQYNFDNEGDEIESNNDVSWSNKLVKGLNIEELTEDQLDSLIGALKQHQTHW